MSDMIYPGESDVLLLVYVQNDFCPDGALAVITRDAIVLQDRA